MILRLSLELPEDIPYIRTARLLSCALLEDIRITTKDISDIETIVGELCANVIRHAQSQEAHFTMVLEYYQLKIVITVRDKGQGFDASSVPAPGTERTSRDGETRIGGFGLSLLAGLSDTLNFSVTNPHGTTVEVTKNLHYRTEADQIRAAHRDQGQGAKIIATSS